MNQEELYRGREQTLIKHFILRKYLERFGHIVGTFADSISYVDCFSGPWNVCSDELKDSSFSIALDELRKARTTLATKTPSLKIKIRCMFLEKEPGSYARLKQFAEQIKDAEVETRNDELAGSIRDILQFIDKGGRRTFPFFFIDPTGWTGFEMSRITPLLKRRPGEVLINFMTDYIRRFIDHPQQQTRDQFEAMFGSADVKDRIQQFSDPQEREEILFRTYAENVQRIGGYDYTCAAIILYPDIDRTFFHLIYATRHPKGVEVFKEVEKKAMAVQEQARAEAKQRKRIRKTSQLELFPGEHMPHSQPIDALRDRYLGLAKKGVLDLLQATPRVPYEHVWQLALSFPLVWESDFKDWVKE